MGGKRRGPWTKVYGQDLLGSTRFMSCPNGARGTWLLLLCAFADDEGKIYAYQEGDPPKLVPYGCRELAAELRIRDSTLRSHLKILLERKLLELVEGQSGIYRIPRFEEKAGEDRRASEARSKMRGLTGGLTGGRRWGNRG